MALENGTNLASKFSHRPAVDLAAFMGSINYESQALAIDGSNAENIQTTGTAPAMVGGVMVPALPVDTELDISADLQLTTWLTATSYTSADMRYTEDANGKKTWFRCITSHTSASTDKPGFGKDWRDNWTKSSQTAENAVGATVATSTSRYFLVTATALGVINIVLAGAAATDGSETLDIPNFDPDMFVAIGTVHVNSAEAFVLGTTALTTIGTYIQITGTCLPKPSNLDRN